MCKKCRFDRCLAYGMRAAKPEPASLMTQVDRPATSLLDLFRAELNSMKYHLLQTEMDLWSTGEYVRLPVRGYEDRFYHTSKRFSCAFVGQAIAAAVRLAHGVFAELEAFTEEEMRLFNHNFLLQFLYLDGYESTRREMPGDHSCMKSSETSVTDFTLLEQQILREHSDNIMVKELVEAVSMYGKGTKEYYRRYKQVQLSNKEYIALHILLMWTFDRTPSIPDHIIRMGERIKERVFAELHEHYASELRQGEYAKRLGALMQAMNIIMEVTSFMQEGIGMYKLLDAADNKHVHLLDAVR